MKTLPTLLQINHHENSSGMILKCDIEGYEWKMFLEAGKDTLKRFDQIVVELHNIVNGHDKTEIIEALRTICKTHIPIHIHANNNSFCCYRGGYVTPNILEVTFVLKGKFSVRDVEKVYPISEDEICNKERKDIIIGRWNVI